MDAVINLWQIPERDAFDLFDKDIDSISGPITIGQKKGLIRLLDKTYERKEDYDDTKKEKYRNRLKSIQSNAFLMEWSSDLFQRAALEDFLPKREIPPPPPATPAPAAEVTNVSEVTPEPESDSGSN